MTDCNLKALEQARANVAEQYSQPYQVRAIQRGDWDRGKFVQDELQRLLRGQGVMVEPKENG